MIAPTNFVSGRRLNEDNNFGKISGDLLHDSSVGCPAGCLVFTMWAFDMMYVSYVALVKESLNYNTARLVMFSFHMPVLHTLYYRLHYPSFDTN